MYRRSIESDDDEDDIDVVVSNRRSNNIIAENKSKHQIDRPSKPSYNRNINNEDDSIDRFGQSESDNKAKYNQVDTTSFDKQSQSTQNDIAQQKLRLIKPCIYQNDAILCYIERQRSGFGLNYVYRCYIETNNNSSSSDNIINSNNNKSGRFVMSAKKKAMTSTSYYLVSMEYDPTDRGSESVLGKIRGNAVGSEYIVYDHGLSPEKTVAPSLLRKELSLIKYSFDSGGPSQIQTYIPSVTVRGVPTTIQPSKTSDGLVDRVNDKRLDNLTLLVNKKPKWDESHKGHVLNFQGRVNQASVKNFQLCVNGFDEVVLQFGKVSDNRFSMDVKHPLSLYQAFAICVCAMDIKVADRKGYELIRSIATSDRNYEDDSIEEHSRTSVSSNYEARHISGSMTGSSSLSGRLRESLPTSQYLRDKISRSFK